MLIYPGKHVNLSSLFNQESIQEKLMNWDARILSKAGNGIKTCKVRNSKLYLVPKEIMEENELGRLMI